MVMSMKARHSLSLVCLLFLLTTSCMPSPSQVSNTSTKSNLTQLPSLRVLAQARGREIGTAVSLDPLQNEPHYRDTLSHQFDLITPENAMKFAAVHPAPNTYTFQDADTIVAFAKAHAMQVRGHNLVWYKLLPNWVTQAATSRAALMAVLRQHIFTVVSHYRNQVNIWDVVNEAVNDDGTLRNSLWLQVIGPDYIDWAFRWAHEANPQAQLYYNDYGGEGLGQKADAVYNLVKGLLQRGVPINGVGLQMHVSIDAYPKPQDVLANMQRLAALGLKVQITEMDVEIQGDTHPLAQKLTLQAQVYRVMLGVCLSVPNCTAFVMWGFTDLHSWIPQFTGHADAPLIFDAAYRPKPAFYALLGALQKCAYHR